MTDRARRLLEDAMTLSDDERLDLAERLLSSLPADAERHAAGGEACDVVKRRLAARAARQ